MEGPLAALRSLPVAALLLALPVASQGKIRWEDELQSALELARKENKMLAACFSMDGERVCRLIVDEHYTDSKIVELSKKTINVFCSPHGTGEQKELEKRVRIDLLKKPSTEYMVAPQHVFFKPDGTLWKAVPYYISAGELEWLWAQAIRQVEPDFAWKPSDRTRAPARLADDEIATAAELPPAPTKRELDEMLREIKKDWGGYFGAREKLPLIVRSESKAAKDFVARILESNDEPEYAKVDTLEIIGRNAELSWWKIVAKSAADDDNAAVRAAAARAIGRFGDRKAVGHLLGRAKREQEPEVVAALLRALVDCDPASSKVTTVVTRLVTDAETEGLAVQATLACARLEDREAIDEGLGAALTADRAKVRTAAAYAVASRQDRMLLPALEAALGKETEAYVKSWLELAAKVVKGDAPPTDLQPLEVELGLRKK